MRSLVRGYAAPPGRLAPAAPGGTVWLAGTGRSGPGSRRPGGTVSRARSQPSARTSVPAAPGGGHGGLGQDELEFSLPLAPRGRLPGTDVAIVTALFGAYLAVLADQPEICLAYPLPLRTAGAQHVEALIGLGVLRLAVDPGLSVTELVRVTQRQILGGIRHPIGAAEALRDRASGANQLPEVIVQAMPGLMDRDVPAGIGSLGLRKVRTPPWTSEFVVDLWIMRLPDELGAAVSPTRPAGFRAPRRPR